MLTKKKEEKYKQWTQSGVMKTNIKFPLIFIDRDTGKYHIKRYH